MSRHPIRRIAIYLQFLSVAVILTLLPLVVLPDTLGPASTQQGQERLSPIIDVLVLPVEKVWDILGQFGTFDTVNCHPIPCLWWHRPPIFFHIALRHSALAIPFWLLVQVSLFEGMLFLRRRLFRLPEAA